VPLDPSDHIAVQQLYAAYNFAADQGNAKAFAECFPPDGVLQLGPMRIQGQEALTEFAAGIGGGIRHLVTNVLVDGEGDVATGSAYLIVLATDSSPIAIRTSGQYVDRLVRASDGWRFSERVFTSDTPRG